MKRTQEKIKTIMSSLKSKVNFRSLVITLAAVVVFTTTYLLVLPAFTLDKDEAAQQGGIDIVAEQTAAEADVEASNESVTVEETVAPGEVSEETDVKATDAGGDEAAAEAKAEEVKDAEEPVEAAAEETEKADEVKLLTKKTTLEAERAKGDDFTVSAEVGKSAKVPEDVTIVATELDKNTDGFQYEKRKQEALEALKKDSKDVNGIKSIKFYDISLESPSQEDSVEPADAVNVTIEFDKGIKVSDADNVRIVHFAEQKNGEVKAEVIDDSKVDTTVNADNKMTETTFETEGFSEFAVVEVETIETSVITADGKTYKVAVTYGKNAGVPEGSRLEVSELTGADAMPYLEKAASTLKKDADDLSFAKFFDIKIMNGDDEVKIENPVNVEIKLLDNETLTDNTQVLHFESKEKADLVDSSVDGDTVKFEAEGFSVYAVVGDPTPESRVTVNFWTYDGGRKIATVYVKNSDVLKEDPSLDPDVVAADGYSYIDDIVADPGVGHLEDGLLFHGWSPDVLMNSEGVAYGGQDTDKYVGMNYTTSTSGMTIEEVRKYLDEFPEIDGYKFREGDVINIYAMVFKYYNVTYFGDDINGDPDWSVSYGSDTVLLRPDETSAPYTVNMAYSPTSNQNFKGWVPTEEAVPEHDGAPPFDIPATAENITLTDGSTLHDYPNNTNVILTGDVYFNVDAPHGNWLVYNANGKGGTFNAPQFYLPTETTSPAANATQANMKRNGYRFEGWFKASGYDAEGNPLEDEDGNVILGEEFSFGSTLSENTNIYAKWTPVTEAPYTIVFWTQNSDRSAYDVAGSYIGNGTVGQPIPFTFNNNTDEDYVTGVGDNGHYTGFGLNHSGTDTLGNLQKTKSYDSDGNPVKETVAIPNITPEGDAVLNIYYDRIRYELRFYVYWDAGSGNNRYSYAHYPQSPGSKTDPRGNVNTFYNNGNNHPSVTADSGLELKSVTAGNYTAYYFVLDAYYGDDISSKWPEYSSLTTVPSGNQTQSPVSFIMMNGAQLKEGAQGTSGQGTVKGVITRMDEKILGATEDADGNFLICRYDTSYNNWRYHIFYEQIDGEDYSGKTTYRYNNKDYYEDHIVESRSSNQNVAEQNPPQFDGFTQTGNSNQTGQTGGNNGNNARWTTGNGNNTLYHTRYYYDRKIYNITYMDGVYFDGRNNIIQTRASELLEENDENIIQGAAIPDQYKNYVPDLPPGEEGYVFEGWYLDEGCTVPYTFTTMPIGGITVHAKWRQVQYRVFLHPEAMIPEENPETGETTMVRDLTLSWGDESASSEDKQQMNFRVSWGDKISLPFGTRKGYEFIGWFKEDGSLYMAGTELNDTTVPATPEYDKETDMTDTMDKFGLIVGDGEKYWISNEQFTAHGDPSNSDADRAWVTRKLDLYGQWRKVVEGSDGIKVIYDVGEIGDEGTKPNDPLLYKDKTGAVAQAACTVDEDHIDDYQFLYWVVQKWDKTANDYVDTEIIVSPGDDFNVLLDYAKAVIYEQHPDPNTGEPIIDRAEYTMQLRAEYGLVKIAKPTHIDWYKNIPTEDASVGDYVSPNHRSTEEGLQINEATAIWSAPTREGYKFVGWARVPTDVSKSVYKDKLEDTTGLVLDNEVARGYLYLEYHADTDTYTVTINGAARVVTEVAADEVRPYHDMYAVWEKVNKLTVKKVVRGGSADDEFSFTPSLKVGDEWTDGDVFKLKDGQSEEVYNDLSLNSKVKVTESVTEGFDYDVEVTGKYTAEDGEEHDLGTLTNGAEITILGDTEITVTNKKKSQFVQIKKVDATDNTLLLGGATFSIGNDVTLTTEKEGANKGFTDSVELSVGDHNVTETVAPEGYNIPDNTITIKINPDGVKYQQSNENSGAWQDAVLNEKTGVYVVTITNTASQPLPHTGGIGTTIFYVLGSLLVIGCGVVLVARRRMKSEEK